MLLVWSLELELLVWGFGHVMWSLEFVVCYFGVWDIEFVVLDLGFEFVFWSLKLWRLRL